MSNKSVLLYLISRLGEKSEGRKKIMKLMFLINHFDISKQKVVKNPLLNQDFIIYHYGVFSFDVMNNFLELSQEKKIEGDFPIGTKISSIPEIPLKVKEKVEIIVDIFGEDSGKRLEVDTLKLLGLNIETKKEYFGESIKKFV